MKQQEANDQLSDHPASCVPRGGLIAQLGFPRIDRIASGIVSWLRVDQGAQGPAQVRGSLNLKWVVQDQVDTCEWSHLVGLSARYGLLGCAALRVTASYLHW